MEGMYNAQSQEGLREIIADLAIELMDIKRQLSIERDYVDCLQKKLDEQKGETRHEPI